MIKFRFYDLEERAEDMAKEGMGAEGLEAVADFVTAITQHKIAFNNAKTTEERKQVIQNVRIDWKAFLARINTSTN